MNMMTDPIAREITRAKIQLLLTQPFFGNMATGLQIILTDAENHAWCSTAATDGRRLYMNRGFVSRLTFDELLFVVAHEVLHVVYDHLSRRQGRDPEYYNMAADYVINYTLVKNKIGTMPPVGLFKEEYNDEMTSEQIYDLLMKNQVTIEMPLDQHLDGMGNASGQDDDDDGDGSDDGDDGDDGDQDGNGDGKDGKDKEGGKNPGGKKPGQAPGGQKPGGKGGKPGKGKGGKGGTIKVRVNGTGDGPPILTKEELDEIRSEVLARTIQAAQSAAAQENAGCIPAGVKRMIAELTEPKMDWRTMLDCHVRSQQKCDFTFQRLSRIELGGGFIFPAEDDDVMVEADVVIDTSGSMSAEMLREICSEIKGIMTSFQDFKLRLCSFDTMLYDYGKTFTPQNIDEIDTYVPKGGGGTDLSCYWNKLKDEGRVPERVVVFTDGYLYGGWGQPDFADTLWVFYGGNREKAPYGTTVYYEDAK